MLGLSCLIVLWQPQRREEAGLECLVPLLTGHNSTLIFLSGLIKFYLGMFYKVFPNKSNVDKPRNQCEP